jgi:hypothetical protein
MVKQKAENPQRSWVINTRHPLISSFRRDVDTPWTSVTCIHIVEPHSQVWNPWTIEGGSVTISSHVSPIFTFAD